MDEDIDNDNMGLEDGHVQALLSAYIDDDLTQAAHEQVRRHIETCPDCRADYIELRATVQMLHIMPTVPPPRAFTLTEQDIAASAPARAGFFQRLLTPRNAPRFAMGSGLALMLLVFMLAGNLFSSRASLTSIGTVAFSQSESQWQVAPSAAQPAQGSTSTAAPAQIEKSAGEVAPPQPYGTPAPTSAAAPPAVEATPPADTALAPGALPAPTEVMPSRPASNVGPLSETTASPTPGGGAFDLGLAGGQSITGTAGQNYNEVNPNLDHLNSTTSENSQRAPLSSSTASTERGLDGTLLFEVSLALLGILLAVGALVSRRR